MQNTILRQVQFRNYMTSVRVVPRKAKRAQSPFSLFLGGLHKIPKFGFFLSRFCWRKCPNSMQPTTVRCWECPKKDEHLILASPSFAPVHLRYHVIMYTQDAFDLHQSNSGLVIRLQNTRSIRHFRGKPE